VTDCNGSRTGVLLPIERPACDSVIEDEPDHLSTTEAIAGCSRISRWAKITSVQRVGRLRVHEK
jgi:hypothetical protein